MKKSFKKLFSVVAVLMIVASQTPLASILWSSSSKAVADYDLDAISNLTVTSPNGSESWNGTHNITWNSVGTWYVDVQYCIEPNCSSANYTDIALTVYSVSGAASYSWNTATAGGDSTQYKVRVAKAGGGLGDISDAYFTVDNTAPAGWSFTINSDASYTTSQSVTLNTTCAVDGLVWWVQVAYGNSAAPTNRTSCSSSMAWTLSAWDATKTVYMRFKDSLGNTTSDTTDTIVLDTTAPTITVTNPNGSPALSKTVTASTSDGTLTMTAWSTSTTCDASRTFVTYASTTFSSDTDNGKYICYKAVDALWNTAYTLSNAIAGIDTTWPTITVTNPDTSPAQTKTVSASPSDGTLTMTTGSTSTTCNGTRNFIANAPTTFTSEADNGKYICYKGVDALWNTTYTLSNAIAGIDTTYPTITINNPDTSRATSKTITASASDGTLLMTTGSTSTTCNGTRNFISYSSTTFSAEADSGKYVCYKSIDSAWNSWYLLSSLIRSIDVTAPSSTNNVPSGWRNSNVTVLLSCSDSVGAGCSKVYYTTDGSDPTTSSSYVNASNSRQFTISTEWDYTIKYRAEDLVNNLEIVRTAANHLQLDKTAASVNAGSDVITNGIFTQVGSVDASIAGISSYTWSKVSWPGTISFWSSSASSTTISANADGTYVIRLTAVDNASNSASDDMTLVWDTQQPTVTFNIPTDASSTLRVAGYAVNIWLSSIDQVQYWFDNDEADWILTLAAGTTQRAFNGTISLTGYELSNWPHRFYVRAHNVAGTRWPAVYQSFNENSDAPDITSLYMSNITDSSAYINWDANMEPDTAEYRIKENNGEYSSRHLLTSPQGIGELNSNTTYIVEIQLTAGVTSSTDSISFTTASASDGIVVDSISRILNGSTPTPGGDYESGYHFRFNLTLNSIWDDTLNFKLADWSNSATTMPVANNTKIFVSENGVSSANDMIPVDYNPSGFASRYTTLTGADSYSDDLDIYGMDANSSKWGNQIVLDMFYKIPLWAEGIFSTNYGIKTSGNRW